MNGLPNRPQLFNRLKAGLEQAIQHAHGEITLKTTALKVAEPPPEVSAVELANLRTGAGLSQFEFSRLLNVSLKTVQSWEQGVRTPSQAALRLIQVFKETPETLFRVARRDTTRAAASSDQASEKVGLE